MSLIFATQLTAVATAILAVFAFATAVFALLAFRKQSEEVRAVKQQVKDQQELNRLQARDLHASLGEREREAQRRLRAQAALVFLTEKRFAGRQAGPLDSSPPELTATVVNSSDQPIYRAEVYWCLGADLCGEPNPDPLGDIMPGQSASIGRKFSQDTNMAAASAELTFRDAGDILWLRRTDGELTDLVAPVRAGSPSIAYRKEGV